MAAITREYLLEQQELIIKSRQELLANLAANQGILQHIELLLSQLETPPEIGE